MFPDLDLPNVLVFQNELVARRRIVTANRRGNIVTMKWKSRGWSVIVCTLLCVVHFGQANPDAKRLYDDLLSTYNRLIRPVSNNNDTVLVKLGLRLSQLIELVSMTLLAHKCTTGGRNIMNSSGCRRSKGSRKYPDWPLKRIKTKPSSLNVGSLPLLLILLPAIVPMPTTYHETGKYW